MSLLTPVPSAPKASHLAPCFLHVLSKPQANDTGQEGPSHKIRQGPQTNDVKDTRDSLGVS